MTTQPSVLVTGAAHRIGRYMALAFARRGWRIGLHFNRSAEAAEATAAEISALGSEAFLLQADLANETAIGDLAGRMAALDNWQALVNSAAIFERDNTASVTRSGWEAHLAINLRAPLLLSQAFAAQVPENTGTADCQIVNIIDAKIWRPNQHFLSYSVTKAGLWHMTQAMALDLAPRIRVNAIGPGPTLPTPGQDEAMFQRMLASQPLPGAPVEDDFDAAIGFLLTARSVTGQMLALDGGTHLGWVVPGRLHPA